MFRQLAEKIEFHTNIYEYLLDESLEHEVCIADASVFTVIQYKKENNCNFYILQSPQLTQFFGIGFQKST